MDIFIFITHCGFYILLYR